MNGWGYSPVVGHLPNMRKALDSNPSTAKKRKKKNPTDTCNYMNKSQKYAESS